MASSLAEAASVAGKIAGNKPPRPPIMSPANPMGGFHMTHDEGPSRRKVLECMTWAGTGVLWTIAGGVPAAVGIINEAMARGVGGGAGRRGGGGRGGGGGPAGPSGES